MKKRLDLLLVELGLAKSRALAQQLISNGLVTLDGRALTKPGQELESSVAASLKILENNLNRYVSRGGLKLEGALERTSLEVRDKIALDVGLSTGGFADCLLQRGAARVVGVDVGQGQLADRLKRDPRVTSLESINARHLTRDLLAPHVPASGFDLAVIDVSFISLELILPQLPPLLAPHGYILGLVKPQFEAGRAALGKSGIVKDPKAFEEVRKKIYKICESLLLDVEDYFESSIQGSDGNQEFFVLARRTHDGGVDPGGLPKGT
ncbi:MAG TPA: TlyA family RNA methyltransferase [Bdellovibrionales bacterium]|nr:TlyA family RNA methyltransferase [Bdellovibrionales bacterium]